MNRYRVLAAAAATALMAGLAASAPLAHAAEPGAVVAVTGANQQVYYHLTGRAGFTALGGGSIYTPSVFVAPSNRVYFLVTGTNHHLYMRTLSDGWRQVDGPGTSCEQAAMALTRTGGGNLTAVVGCRGSNNVLYTSTSTFADGAFPTWTSFTSWGGQMSGTPAIAAPSDGGAPTFYVLGTDRPSANIYAKSSANGTWRPVGNYACGWGPAVAVRGSTTYLTCPMASGAPLYAVNNGSGWGSATALSGQIVNTPALVAGSGSVSMYAQGTSGGLYQRSGLPGGAWVGLGGSLLAGAAAAELETTSAVPGTTIRINSETGGDPNGQSSRGVISPDGAAIGFHSIANNFTGRPEYGAYDVFVTNLATRQTQLVSYAYDGSAGNGISTYPAVSNGGTYVAFMSAASNILPNDNNPGNDIFVRNMATGVVRLVSVASNGQFGGGTRPTISADGRYISFNASGGRIAGTPAFGGNNVYVRDMVAGTTKLITGQGNGESIRSMISPDGTTVTFMSEATNLDAAVRGTDSGYDVYQANIATGAIRLVSATPSYDEAGSGSAGDADARAAVSMSGRFVVFQSSASDLVAGDTNGQYDIFERDMALAPGQPGAMRRVSVRANGDQTTGSSTRPTVNGDGTLVTYATNDALVVPNDRNQTRDVVLRNMATGTNLAVSVGLTGTTGDCSSSAPAGPSLNIRPGASCIASRPQIDMPGNRILFIAGFTNLVPNDSNKLDDVFVRFLR